MDIHSPDVILERIKSQAAADDLVLTLHAAEEMQDEAALLDEVLAALADSSVLENYPTFYKGPCCLVCGLGNQGRYLHVVCSTSRPKLIIAVPLIIATLLRRYHHLKCVLDYVSSTKGVADQMIPAITTVYEPKPPKWVTPTERGQR